MLKKFNIFSAISLIIIFITGCDQNETIHYQGMGGIRLDIANGIEQANWPAEFSAHITITSDEEGGFEDIERDLTIQADTSSLELYRALGVVEVPTEVDMHFCVYFTLEGVEWNSGEQPLYLGANETKTVLVAFTPYSVYELRTTVTWGSAPQDLDLHLLTPLIGAQTYHIYYGNEGYYDQAPYAFLDWDDTDGYGPETITIIQRYPGNYYFYVHNYSGEVPLAGCGAQVEVSDQDQILQNFTIPSSGTGDYWNLFILDGSSGLITSVNQISSAPIAPSGGNQAPVAPNKIRAKISG